MFWIFGYDIVVIGFDSTRLFLVNQLAFVWDFLLLVAMFSLTTLLFIKINKNIKQLSTFDIKEKQTLNDMKRAAVICLIDSVNLLLHLIPANFSQLFNTILSESVFYDYLKNENFFSKFLIYAYFSCTAAFGPFYSLGVIIDLIMTICILKQYRNAFLRFFGFLKNIVRKNNHTVSLIKTTSTVR